MKTLVKADFARFTGSEQWHRHGLDRDILLIDGPSYVAYAGGAYWLLDEIAFVLRIRGVAGEQFQVWKLMVRPDKTAVLTCDDGNDNTVFMKRIAFIDFPLDEIRFCGAAQTILLPSEY